MCRENAPAKSDNAKTFVVLLDTSLSMQWEKLERSISRSRDVTPLLAAAKIRFNLILFNSKGGSKAFQPEPVAADSSAVQHALEFVRRAGCEGWDPTCRSI